MRSTGELDKLGVQYEVRRHNGASKSAVEAAQTLGLQVGSIVKTLILVGQTVGPIVVLVPGDRRLNLKSLGEELGDRKLHLARHDETLEISGYPVGLVTPFGLRQKLPVYVCSGIDRDKLVGISSGQSGAELVLTAADLLAGTNATEIGAHCAEVMK